MYWLQQLLLVPVLLAGVDLVSQAERHALGLGPDADVAWKGNENGISQIKSNLLLKILVTIHKPGLVNQGKLN